VCAAGKTELQQTAAQLTPLQGTTGTLIGVSVALSSNGAVLVVGPNDDSSGGLFGRLWQLAPHSTAQPAAGPNQPTSSGELIDQVD
jgi:hypothetical protein